MVLLTKYRTIVDLERQILCHQTTPLSGYVCRRILCPLNQMREHLVFASRAFFVSSAIMFKFAITFEL